MQKQVNFYADADVAKLLSKAKYGEKASILNDAVRQYFGKPARNRLERRIEDLEARIQKRCYCDLHNGETPH